MPESALKEIVQFMDAHPIQYDKQRERRYEDLSTYAWIQFAFSDKSDFFLVSACDKKWLDETLFRYRYRYWYDKYQEAVDISDYYQRKARLKEIERELKSSIPPIPSFMKRWADRYYEIRSYASINFRTRMAVYSYFSNAMGDKAPIYDAFHALGGIRP